MKILLWMIFKWFFPHKKTVCNYTWLQIVHNWINYQNPIKTLITPEFTKYVINSVTAFNAQVTFEFLLPASSRSSRRHFNKLGSPCKNTNGNWCIHDIIRPSNFRQIYAPISEFVRAVCDAPFTESRITHSSEIPTAVRIAFSEILLIVTKLERRLYLGRFRCC